LNSIIIREKHTRIIIKKQDKENIFFLADVLTNKKYPMVAIDVRRALYRYILGKNFIPNLFKKKVVANAIPKALASKPKKLRIERKITLFQSFFCIWRNFSE